MNMPTLLKQLSIIGLFLLMPTAVLLAQLGPGDMAIVGLASNVGDDDLAAYCETGLGSGRDRVSVVFFEDITTGTVVEITDNGWERRFANMWGNSEGVIQITRTGGTIPKGTTVTFEFSLAVNGNHLAIAPDNAWTFTDIGTNAVNFNSAGDQIFFLSGGAWNNGTGCPIACNQDATYSGSVLYGFSSTTFSALPVGNASNNASDKSRIPPDIDPCFYVARGLSGSNHFTYYNGPITACSQEEWVARIRQPANWTANLTCASYTGPPPFFPISSSTIGVSCSGNCSGCAPLTSNVQLTIQGVTATAGPFTVVLSNGTNSQTINNATNGQIVQVTSTVSGAWEVRSITVGGCPIDFNFDDVADITVSPSPAYSDFTATTAVCPGTEIDLTLYTYNDVNSTGATVTFHSALPPTAANEITNGLYTFNNTQTVYGVALSPDGCRDTFPITVNTLPSSNSGVPQDTTFCFRSSGSSNLSLSNLLTGETAGGVWSVDIGSPNAPGINFTAATGTVNPNNLPIGTYIFNYTANALCPDGFSQVNVVVTPSATASAAGPLTECGSGIINFDLTTLNTTIDASSAGMVMWYSNPTATASIVSPNSYPTNMNVTVYAQITTPDGCKSNIIPVNLVIQPNPTAGSVTNPTPVCFRTSGNPTINLANQLTGETTGGTWASTGDNPGANFNVATATINTNNLPAGTYIFNYDVTTANCGSANNDVTVIVNPSPVASAVTGLSQCASGSATFDLTSLNGDIDPSTSG
ncbi:MAG: hypothetical protein WAS72_13305, partial [Saprospiraceae bacterium]